MEVRAASTMYVTTGLHGGGAERLLRNMLLRQEVRGTMFVVTLMPGGVFRRTLEEAGISVTDLGMSRYRHALRAVFALAALIRARRPSAIYGWMYHANVLSMMALLLAGLPRTQLFW